MIVSTSGKEPYATIFTDGKSEAACDTTFDKGGGGSGFRPHDLLEAAFACCLNISLRMAADKHKIPLREAKVSVLLNRDDPEQTIFEYAVELQGDLTVQQSRELLKLAASCPVSRTMSKKISFCRSSPAPAL
ncbi:MAG: OsmC family protein [Syntrophobacteraceae bacterium]